MPSDRCAPTVYSHKRALREKLGGDHEEMEKHDRSGARARYLVFSPPHLFVFSPLFSGLGVFFSLFFRYCILLGEPQVVKADATEKKLGHSFLT